MRSLTLAAALCGACSFLSAQQIVAASSGLASPTTIHDFGAGVLPNFTPVTTQFPGLTIFHGSYFTTGTFNNLVGGFLTNDFSAGLPNTLRIQFGTVLSACSFVYHQVGNGTSNVRVLLQGVPVDSFSGSWTQYQPNNYFGFQGVLFDSLEIDFQADFNFDTLAIVDSGGARCDYHNGNGLNPPDFTCLTLPVLGSLWQGVIAGNANTMLTFLAFAPGGYATPSPLFGGELLIDTSVPPVAFAGFGSYSMAIPAGAGWQGTVLTFQGFRVDQLAGGPTFVPLNANDLVFGL